MRIKLLIYVVGICGVALMLCAASCSAQMPEATSAPVAIDSVVAAQSPLDLRGARAAVLFFIGIECPVSNGYAPEMNRLCRNYAGDNVNFYMVCTDADASPAAIHAHAQAYGFMCPTLPDPQHELAHFVGATTTPEAVVIGPGAKVFYRGRIDDLYITLGQRRFEARRHDLQDALDAVLAGRPVAAPSAPAVGCSIGA